MADRSSKVDTKLLKVSFVVNENVFPGIIIHVNKNAYAIITKALLCVMQKDSRRKQGCCACCRIGVYNSKKRLHSFETDAEIDDTKAKQLGDTVIVAPISIPQPAAKWLQNVFGLPPAPVSPSESNKVILFNKANTTPLVLQSILTTRYDSTGYPELAFLDQRTFSSADGVLDENLCRAALVAGAPIYRHDGKQLYGISVPSKRNPLACIVITSDFFGWSGNRNPEKNSKSSSERPPAKDRTLKTEEQRDTSVASCSREGGTASPERSPIEDCRKKIDPEHTALCPKKNGTSPQGKTAVKDEYIDIQAKEPKGKALACSMQGGATPSPCSMQGGAFTCSMQGGATPSPPRDILFRSHPGAIASPLSDKKMEISVCAEARRKPKDDFPSDDETGTSVMSSSEKDSENEDNAFHRNDNHSCPSSLDDNVGQMNAEDASSVPTGEEQQQEDEPNFPEEPRGRCRSRNLGSLSTVADEDNSPDHADYSLRLGTEVVRNAVSQLDIDSGYSTSVTSRETQVRALPAGEDSYVSGIDRECSEPASEYTDNVAPPSREHQQATIRHPQHREEENHHPHLVEYRQGNVEELPEPPPEVPENCRSARSLSDMAQPSSLPDNDCAVVEPKAKDLRNDKGDLKCGFHKECGHRLKEAGFNERQELSLRLDRDTFGQNGWYALSKQFNFISEQTRTRLYMAHFGGGCAAMSYLIFMSTGPKQMKVCDLLNDFLTLGMDSLVHYVCENVLDSVSENTFLYDLPYNMLQYIATEISPKPQQPRNLQKIWKNLAGLQGLELWEIESIENSQVHPGSSSPAEELLAYIDTVRPFFKLSDLAKGLVGINRLDLLIECSIFSQCFEHNCISLIE